MKMGKYELNEVWMVKGIVQREWGTLRTCEIKSDVNSY